MKKISIFFSILLLIFMFSLPLETSAASIGDKLDSFTSKTMQGDILNLDKIIGDKPVLLFFWATW